MARTIRLHLRFPTGWHGADAFVDKLQSLFDSYPAELRFAVATSQGIDDVRLRLLNVDPCLDAPSATAAAIFNDCAPGGTGGDDVFVVFADRFEGAVRWGCSQSPNGCRGVMISSQAATVTLAHEIGHLFLGPGHDADANNLMYHNLATGTPFVSNSQLALLQAGQWFVSAAAPFVAFAGKPIVIPPIVTAPKRRPRKPSDRVKATRPKKAKGPRTGRARKRTPTKRTLKPADKPAKKPAKKRSSRKKVR